MIIEANPALVRIDALRALSQVGPRFLIVNNSLANLDGLEGLQVVEQLNVAGNPMVVEVPEFDVAHAQAVPSVPAV